MTGCFNHEPFNSIANKRSIQYSSKQKTKRFATEEIFSSTIPVDIIPFAQFCHLRKTSLFFSDENHFINIGKRRSRINKIWTQKSPKFCPLFPKSHREPWKVQNSFLGHHQPASCFSPSHRHIHKNKQIHSLPQTPSHPQKLFLRRCIVYLKICYK